MVPVQLYTKKHIKAYLLNNFGPKPCIDSTHIFHNYLLLCFSHTLQLNIEQFLKGHTEEMAIYITRSDYKNYGSWLNARQMHFFNRHVDQYMKDILFAKIDTFLEMDKKPVLKEAIYYGINNLKVTDDDWEYETIVKSYYRYRTRNNLPLLYVK